MVVTQMQRENCSCDSDKLTNNLVRIMLKILAVILLDVFVTKLQVLIGKVYGSSSCREGEEEQERFSFLTSVLWSGQGKEGGRVVGKRERENPEMRLEEEKWRERESD